MDVAIQARFDASQALKDSDALFQKLAQVQTLAANIKVSPALTGQITGIANATAILANAQLALQANIQLTNNAATAAANALARMAAAQQALNVNTTQNISITNNQSSALGALTGRILSVVASYISLRSILNLVHEAMDARIEMDRLEIGMRAITTSAEDAGAAVNFLTVETNRLGINMRATIPEFVKMMASLTSSGMSFQESERAFTNLSIATKAVGLSSAATGRILYDLQEMAALGTVQMRQLRQMLMQLPGALQAFSQAAGLSTAQFLEQVHKGMIDPSFIATKGLQALADKYAHEMPEAMDTLESHVNRLKNSWMQLLAEMGKSPAIKNVVDSANSVLTVATVVEKLNQLKSSTGHTWQQAGIQERAYMLRNAFPDAKEFGQPIDYTQATGFKGTESFQVPNYVNTYLRMQREQAWADSHKPATAGGGTGEKELTEAQMDAFDKIEEIRKRTEAEVLTGLEKEYAQIDANAKRQMDAIDKEQQKLGTAPGAQDAAARARLDVLVAANAAKKEALDKDNAANVTSYLEQMKQDSTDVSNIMRDLIPDETERKIAEIDERFEKMRDHLTEIQDRSPGLLPPGWEDSLDAARRKAENDVKAPKSASRYSGQDFNSLLAQRDQLKQSLLTQDDAEQFQKTAQQIAEISQQLALQLKNDATSIGDAFTFGFKEALDQWGSLSERMAKVGNQLADSVAGHMTDALTGLIEGTKSAQQAFSEMAIGITEDLIRVAIEELVVKQIIAGIGAISGAAGGGGGETAGGTISLDHQGGVAGESARSAHVFGGFSRAPRFHTGGVMGDEVPIVARRGEVIFTPEQMKALTASRGGSGPQKVEIANYTDPRDIDAHIARNPHVIVNAIMSQKKKVQRILDA